jgi:hypothetical protein
MNDSSRSSLEGNAGSDWRFLLRGDGVGGVVVVVVVVIGCEGE